MHLHSFFTTASSLLAIVSRVSASDPASDVLSLTADTFSSVVDNEKLILLEFFAPWCGHCKALAPHYEESATALKAKGIPIAKVDCVEEAELCQTHGVQGYPTLKIFRNGEASDYNGPRKADGIISHMIKQSLPAVSEVTSTNHEEFQTSDKLVVVAYVSSKSDPLLAEFYTTAEKYRDDYLFGLVTDPDVSDSAAVKPPAIVVYRSFDVARVEYPYPLASAKSEDIATWVNDLSIPIIDEVSGDNYAIYASSGKPLAYVFLDPSDETKEELIAELKPVAEKYKSKINFVWIDASKFGDHAKALNLGESKWPSFVIQDLTHQLKYPIPQTEAINAATVDKQTSSYLDGKLEPTLKSEPIPENENEPVTTLVGKNFDDIVFDDSKDVFIELYAPWCGHCKKLKPTWDSLALHYGEVKDKLVIAKMDATENDLPASVTFRVAGFPTIKFKAAGQKEFIDYDGDRTLESLIAFVDEHAKNNVEVKPKESTAASSESATATPAATPVPPAETPEQATFEEHDEL